MKNKKRFLWIDIIIYFNIFIFIGSGIIGIKNGSEISFSIVFFIIAALNLLYLIIVISYRIKLLKVNEENARLEYQMEQSLQEESNIDLNRIKQLMLENRIEAAIENILPESKIIKNAYIPKSDGSFTEIDLIVINQKGIFIIESKNITGKIIGSWKEEYLRIQHPNGEEYKLYNPIMQNTNHYYALRNILGLQNDLFRSIIVFGDHSYIENFRDIPFYASICRVNTLINSMNKLHNRFKIGLEQYEIDSIYNTIIPFIKETDEKKNNHLKRLQENEAE